MRVRELATRHAQTQRLPPEVFSGCCAVQEVRKNCSVAIGDRIIHVKKLFEVSEDPTHDSNVRFDEDLPVREFPQERLVPFCLYVAKEPSDVEGEEVTEEAVIPVAQKV